MNDIASALEDLRKKERFIEQQMPGHGRRYRNYSNVGCLVGPFFGLGLIAVVATLVMSPDRAAVPLMLEGVLFAILVISGRAGKRILEEAERIADARQLEAERQQGETHENVKIITKDLGSLTREVATLTRELLQRSLSEEPSIANLEFDYFISHATEDKDDFVRPLYHELRALEARVFYDEGALKVGDSLRRNIDYALSKCRFGIVVLSSSYFKKAWPGRELDGLVTQELAGKTRILPIWHRVTKDEVMSYSPPLADKVALNTSLMSVKEIARELRDLLRADPRHPQ